MAKFNIMEFHKRFAIFPCLIAGMLIACNKNKEDTPPQNQGSSSGSVITIDVLAKNLNFPWGLAYLPNGDLLFSERPGRLSLLKKDSSNPTLLLSRQVQQNGEGGLLGIAVDPDFQSNAFVYTYETADDNRVVRYKLIDGTLTEDKIIVQGIPKANNHDGGVIQFGPDGYLYIGTGDALQPSSAQDLQSLAGKILRVDGDGNPAPGNPFNNLIWSYGHRNVQGLTWNAAGIMLATEHGPSGDLGWCCHDELNKIEKGKNYGWPHAHAGQEKDGLTPAIAESGNDTWAPSGCCFTGNSSVWPQQVVVACLRGQRFERFSISSDANTVTGRSDTLHQKFGRLRNIIPGPDGSLVFCTSNGNDQIMRIRTQ